MIELTILEPDELSVTTLIDSTRLAETITENMPFVPVGTIFVVDGAIMATRTYLPEALGYFGH